MCRLVRIDSQVRELFQEVISRGRLDVADKFSYVSIFVSAYLFLKRISGVVSARVIRRLSDPLYPTNLFLERILRLER